MNVKFFCKGLSPQMDRKLQDYVGKKLASFEKLLSSFDDDTIQLQITAQRFEKNNAYNVEMILAVPRKKLVGVEASHSIEKAVDLAKDRIIKQLKKMGEQLRDRRKKQEKKEGGIIVGLERVHRSLETYKKKDQKQEFQEALRPLLKKLEQFVRRELFHQEKLGKILHEEGNEAMIIDEVVAEFYENFHASLETRTIEQWLYTVALRKIEEMIQEHEKEKNVKTSLDKNIKTSNHEMRLKKFFMNDEREMLENALFQAEEEEVESPVKNLRKSETFAYVIEKLTDIPPMQRHAFMLNATEGFSLERIAKMQKRAVKEVQNDIEQVRNVLMEALQKEFGEEVM